MSRFAPYAVALVIAIATLTAPVFAVSPPVAASTSDLSPDPSINASASTVRVESVYPNPVTDGDRGEFVHLSARRCPNVTITDGETRGTIETNAANARTHVVVTDDPRAPAIEIIRSQYPNLTAVESSLALANGGERISVSCGDRAADETRYSSAREGEQWIPSATSPRESEGVWRRPGRDPRDVRTYGATNATAFVLPDAPGVPIAALGRADRRILLAGYTFSSARIARELVAALERGVEVRLLLEGKPVGGLSANQAALLDRLHAAGANVTVLGGPRARFSFHHAKYAVVDGTALVLTENWKPAGTGGRSSRGWGVRLDSPAIADDLAGLFAADASAHDAIPWTDFRRGRTFAAQPAANGSYPRRFTPESIPVERVQVLTAPGNAEQTVISLIDGATERVDVIQPTIGSRDGPFLGACLRAAKRGVEVRILLAGAWYVVEENRRLVEGLNAYADRQGIPLTARIAEPRSRYEKIHAKGLLVDGETVVVGSMNWNRHSARENREVAVALRGRTVTNYFGRVFDADWRGGAQRLPLTLGAAALGAIALAIGAARRTVSFENQPPTDERSLESSD